MLATTKLAPFVGDVILTMGMIDATTGQRIFGVFARASDAAAEDADARALGTVGPNRLSDVQRMIAAANSMKLEAPDQ